MHDAEGDRRGTVGSGVSWFAAKIRPANFQVNLRARIQDLNRRQGLPSSRCYAVASRGGNWDLVLKLIWKLEEGNFRRVAKSLSLAESDEKVPQPCDIRSGVGFSLRNWFIGRRLKPTLRLQKKRRGMLHAF